MQLILKRKQFATYGVNNNFTSVSYSPGSIQANPSATTMTSTGKSYRPPRSLGSYTTTNSPKATLSHVAPGPVKNSPLRKVSSRSLDSYAKDMRKKIRSFDDLPSPEFMKRVNFKSNLDPTMPPSKWAGRISPPSRGERMVNMVKGIGRNIGGLFTGK